MASSDEDSKVRPEELNEKVEKDASVDGVELEGQIVDGIEQRDRKSVV